MALMLERSLHMADPIFLVSVRLLDGDQVLAERRFNLLCDADQLAWRIAASELAIHDGLLAPVEAHPPDPHGMDDPSIYFMAAVRALFPDFGAEVEGLLVE